MELSSFKKKKKKTHQTGVVAAPGVAWEGGLRSVLVAAGLDPASVHAGGGVGLEGRGSVWRCRRPARGVLPALERPAGPFPSLCGDRPGWRGKWPHPGPRVWVCWAGVLAAGRARVYWRPAGLQAQVRVQSPGWVLGRAGRPGSASGACGSDFTQSFKPTAPSLALDPVLLALSPRRWLLHPRGPAVSWLAPGVSTPSCPCGGPSGCFCPLRHLP